MRLFVVVFVGFCFFAICGLAIDVGFDCELVGCQCDFLFIFSLALLCLLFVGLWVGF